MPLECEQCGEVVRDNDRYMLQWPDGSLHYLCSGDCVVACVGTAPYRPPNIVEGTVRIVEGFNPADEIMIPLTIRLDETALAAGVAARWATLARPERDNEG